VALETGLISYYSLEHNAKDSVGSNDGTITGATSIGGKIASGYDFNGSSDYITLPTMNDGSFSISMWINADSITANRRVFDMKEASQNRGIRAYFNGTSLVTNVYDDTTSSSVTTTGITTSAGWQHLVITSNSTGDLIVYIDNTNKGTDSTGGAMVAPTDGKLLYICQSGSSGDYFDGLMDEVGIWNRALSSTEVTSLYNSGDGMQLVDGTFTAPDSKTQGMVSYYTLNGHVKDLIAANDGTVTGATLTDGKVGQGYDFNGSSDYINTGIRQDEVNAITTGTFSVWFRATISATDKYILDIGNGEFSLQWDGTSSPLQIKIWDGSNSHGIDTTKSSWNLNQWYNIIFIWGGGGQKIYIDGSPDNTSSDTTLPRSRVDNFLTFGSRWDGSANWFTGQIDEFGIWDRALSSTEITALWNAGDGKTFYEDFIDEPDMKEELTSYYKLDENAANTTVVDSHGSNTGTASGNTSTLYDASGKINSAFDFNGSSDKIEGFGIDLLTNNFSVSVWFNLNTVSVLQYIVSQSASTNGHMRFSIDVLDTGKIQVRQHHTSGDSSATGTTSLSTGAWYHAMAISNSDGIKLYLDGELEATISNTNDLYGSDNQGVAIGFAHYGSSTNYYVDGKIDEVGIWDRALSSTEVTALSNVFAYPFEAASGWSNKMFSIVPGKILAIDVANVTNVIGIA